MGYRLECPPRRGRGGGERRAGAVRSGATDGNTQGKGVELGRLSPRRSTVAAAPGGSAPWMILRLTPARWAALTRSFRGRARGEGIEIGVNPTRSPSSRRPPWERRGAGRHGTGERGGQTRSRRGSRRDHDDLDPTEKGCSKAGWNSPRAGRACWGPRAMPRAPCDPLFLPQISYRIRRGKSRREKASGTARGAYCPPRLIPGAPRGAPPPACSIGASRRSSALRRRARARSRRPSGRPRRNPRPPQGGTPSATRGPRPC